MENFKGAKWRLASSLAVQAPMDSCVLESELHAVERVPAEGRGKLAQFIPIRFLFTSNLSKDAVSAHPSPRSSVRMSIRIILHG
jgi:hypothetical protein